MNRYDIALCKKPPPKIWNEMTGQEQANLFNTVLDAEIKQRRMILPKVIFDQLYGCNPGLMTSIPERLPVAGSINPTQASDCVS